MRSADSCEIRPRLNRFVCIMHLCVGVAALVALSACAGGHETLASQMAQDSMPPEPRTLADAERELARAKAELGIEDEGMVARPATVATAPITRPDDYLNNRTGVDDGRPQPGARPAQPPTPAPALKGSTLPDRQVSPAPATPPAEPSVDSPRAAPRSVQSNAAGGEEVNEELSREAERAQVRQCLVPCRALRSMGRAARAICRLTSATDARCLAAQDSLRNAISRTSSCNCPLSDR